MWVGYIVGIEVCGDLDGGVVGGKFGEDLFDENGLCFIDF